MVQTGNTLIRSHRRSANSLASMMFQLRAQAVPLSPPARQVQAEASDETTGRLGRAACAHSERKFGGLYLRPLRHHRVARRGEPGSRSPDPLHKLRLVQFNGRIAAAVGGLIYLGRCPTGGCVRCRRLIRSPRRRGRAASAALRGRAPWRSWVDHSSNFVAWSIAAHLQVIYFQRLLGGRSFEAVGGGYANADRFRITK